MNRHRPLCSGGWALFEISPKFTLMALLALFAVRSLVGQQQPGGEPLQPIYEDGAEFRWLQKTVLASRLLDGMEDLSKWTFKGEGEIQLSNVEVKSGKHSLQIHSSYNMGRVDGSGDWQDLVATRSFPSEDWRAFNRLSIWAFPDVEGSPALSASLILHNEGAHSLPDNTNEGRHESIPLKNRQWNHIVWEITPLDRDKVTGLDFAYSMPKMFSDPGDKTVLYIDQLELEKVDPDRVEGWDVAPGKIAFSHSGYGAGASKTAIASELTASEFSLVNADSGNVEFTRPITKQATALGDYQVLDFSEMQKPGRYFIRAGSISTRQFRIGDDAWDDSIQKVLNFMYTERCGTVIPGVHGICHQDDYSVHGDKRIVINGGYHDAGDLTATGNITGMTYALFELAERLGSQGENPILHDRVIDEAKWGLAWILKTRFGDGYRSTGQLISYWTDGIMGDADDRFGQAVNDPEWNFRVAADEALAARVLKSSDPALAHRSLATAREDWRFGMEGLEKAAPLPEIYGQKDELERTSFAAIASIDLFQATGEQQFADAAVRFGDQVVASQERRMQPWSIPMTGYFYTGPQRENLFHRFHIGQEEEPIVALAHLCAILQDDPHWMKWYSAIVMHSKYYQQVAASVDAPYNMLPAAVYRDSEVKLLPQSKAWTPLRTADRDVYVDEVHHGIPLGGDSYLRRFPVWFDFRGNSSVLLSEAKALSVAAQARGDIAAEDLAQQQAQWIVGRNPFSTSIMYGEGYDWTPLYSVRSGQIVGSIPVGIETRGVADEPYWPTQICWTYKEVWSQPAGEWIWIMKDLSGPASVTGFADKGADIDLVNRKTGDVTKAIVDRHAGTFRAAVSQGQYMIRQGEVHVSLTALAAGSYHVDLRRDRAIDFKADAAYVGPKEIDFRLSAEGAGLHAFSVRVDNLELTEPVVHEAALGQHGKQEIHWHAHVIDPLSPWVAVFIADGSMDQRKELTGVVLAK